jgi:hypothetical protein
MKIFRRITALRAYHYCVTIAAAYVAGLERRTEDSGAGDARLL